MIANKNRNEKNVTLYTSLIYDLSPVLKDQNENPK